MSATTRWVSYSTTVSGYAGDGDGQLCKGTQGYSLATATVGDSFSINSSNNKLYITIDGSSGPVITLTSGTSLDPRFVARDVSEKLHNLGKNDVGFDQSQCVWENNQLKLYSGTLGLGSSVAIVSGTGTAHLTLGWGTKTESAGSASTTTYSGGVLVSGNYDGFLDEVYRIVINKEVNIGTPAKGGTNSYTGTITAGGVFNHTSSITYDIFIDTTNGTTVGAGTGNVPEMTWISTGNADNSATAIELLYPNYWYKVGTKGLMVKFTDAIFNTCANPDYAYRIACTYPHYVSGSNTSGVPEVGAGVYYIWGSTRGDDATVPVEAKESTYTVLGSRGLSIKFSGSGGTLTAGDEFYVVCTAPQPQSYDISNLNFGNVTVSTESPVKCVVFEIMSGAVEMSTVKFGLQNHGSFSHHDAGNSDTYFRFGTVGPANTGTGAYDGHEWHYSVVAGDLNQVTTPAYLYAHDKDLAVVTDADNSETVGAHHYMGIMSDPIFLNIKLGTSETGANSTINFRLFFDYV